MKRLTVDVPATVANCGPGFDAIGVAIDLVTRIEASIEGDAIVVSYEGPYAAALADAPTDASNLLARTFLEVSGADAPSGVVFSEIVEAPVGRGFGSSASAIVGGIVLAQGFGFAPDDDPLARAIEIEGHPDNVAPCLRGGITVTAGGETVRFDPPPGWLLLLAVSPTTFSTSHARTALPSSFSFDETVRQAGRAALLVAAIASGDLAALHAATDDLVHQPSRLAAMPASAGIVREWRDAGLPAFLSGAGPSVAAFIAAEDADEHIVRARATAPDGWEILAADLRAEGARLIR